MSGSPRCDSRIAPACVAEGEHLLRATHVRCNFASGHPGEHAAATVRWTDAEACEWAHPGGVTIALGDIAPGESRTIVVRKSDRG